MPCSFAAHATAIAAWLQKVFWLVFFGLVFLLIFPAAKQLLKASVHLSRDFLF